MPVAVCVVLAGSCGGSAPHTTPPGVHTPGTGGPTPQLAPYLRAVRPSLARLGGAERTAIAALARMGRVPTRTSARAATAAARIGARESLGAAARLVRLRPAAGLVRAQRTLVAAMRLEARGLSAVAGDLARWPFGAAGGLGRLDEAAVRARGWVAPVRREARARGVPVPAWVPAESHRLRALGHVARAALAESHRWVAPAGASVTTLQRRLAALRYLAPGYATGRYDPVTRQAVIAFQGWEGLARDGIAGPATLARLRTARVPRPWSAVGRHMELHEAQQVLLLVEDAAVVRAIHVSTAAPGYVTPDGAFSIYRKERMSWSVPFQVWMPYASYFTGGYALHEYPDVPPYPASHGCVRVPAGDSIVVWDFATIGTPIEVG